MLLSIIISFSLFIVYQCLNTLTLTTSQSYEIGTIDSDNIVLFNGQKTGIFNLRDKSMTYIARNLSVNTYPNLPVSGKSGSTYYIFGGSQCISSQNESIQNIFSFSYSNHLIIPYTDSDDNTKGFITFSGSSLISFYVFGSGYQSTLTSCPTSITTTVYGGIYISLTNQLYQIIQYSSSYTYVVIYNVTSTSVIYERKQQQSVFVYNPPSGYKYFLTTKISDSKFVLCGISRTSYTCYDYYSNPQVCYHSPELYCQLVSYGINYADLTGPVYIKGMSAYPSYYKMTILSEKDKLILFSYDYNDLTYFFTISYQSGLTYDSNTLKHIDTGGSVGRFTRINSTSLYFAFFSTVSNVHQGFLYKYPVCINSYRYITNFDVLTLKELLDKEEDETLITFTLVQDPNIIKTKSTNNLITNGIAYLVDDLYVAPNGVSSFSKYTFRTIYKPEIDIFEQITSFSQCEFQITACIQNCSSCVLGEPSNCNGNCNNDRGYYYQELETSKKCILVEDKNENEVYVDANKTISLCYPTCKKCDNPGYGVGTISNQKCNLCIDGYYFKQGTHNCYQNTPSTKPYGYGFDSDLNMFVQCDPYCTDCTQAKKQGRQYCKGCKSGHDKYYIPGYLNNEVQCLPTRDHTHNFTVNPVTLEYNDIGIVETCLTEGDYKYLVPHTGECAQDCMYRGKDSTQLHYYSYYNKCLKQCPADVFQHETTHQCTYNTVYNCRDVEFGSPLPEDGDFYLIDINNNYTIVPYLKQEDNVVYKIELDDPNVIDGYFYYENNTLIEYDSLFFVDRFLFKPTSKGKTITIKYKILQNGMTVSDQCYFKFHVCAEGCTQGCSSGNYCPNYCKPGLYFIQYPTEEKCIRKCPSSHPFYAEYSQYTQCYEDCSLYSLYTYKDKCVSICPLGTSPVLNNCIESSLNANSIENYVEASSNKTEMDSFIASSLTSLLEIHKTIKGEDYSLQVYSTDDEIISDYTSSIDFSECESELKAKKIINQNSHLIITKYDINYNSSYTNNIEFTIYDSNGKEIDKSYCADTNISVSYPLYNRGAINFTFTEEMNNQSIDVFNPEDEFFNDICYRYSSNGKDILIQDRRNYIYDNTSLCEPGCIYKSINYTSNTVNCECNFNFSSDKMSSLNFTKEDVDEHNIFTMKCGYDAFKWKNLSSNPGFWTSSVMMVGQVAMVGMFLKNGLSVLTMLASPTEKEKEDIFVTVLFKNNPIVNEKNFHQINTGENDQSSSRDIIRKNSSADVLPKVNEDIIKNKDALVIENENDGRILFFKTLAKDHYLFKPFCGRSEYEPFSFYFSLLIFCITISLVLNALMISNKDISYRYLNKMTTGRYMLRAFYVSLIEIGIKFILRKATNKFGFFALMAKEYKKEKKVESAKDFVEKYSKRMKGKIVLFFIVQFIISLAMGYYLSTFCYTYSKSLEMWIITFVISVFYSIVYSIMFSVFLVVASVYGSRYHNSLIYKIGIFLQSFVIN